MQHVEGTGTGYHVAEYSKHEQWVYLDSYTVHDLFSTNLSAYWCLVSVGNGWVAGGCWDDDITDEMDHSREFPA